MAQAADEQKPFLSWDQLSQMQQQQQLQLQEQMTPQQIQHQDQQFLRQLQFQMQEQQRMNLQNGQQLQQPGQALQNPNIAMPATAVMPAQIPQQKQYQPGPELPNSNASIGNAARAARPQSAARNQAQDSSPAPPAQNLTRAGQLIQDPHARYRAIWREEEERAQEQFYTITMTTEEKAATEELLKATVPILNVATQFDLPMYLVRLDDERVREFFQGVSYSLV
jgi:hypothetical protein